MSLSICFRALLRGRGSNLLFPGMHHALDGPEILKAGGALLDGEVQEALHRNRRPIAVPLRRIKILLSFFTDRGTFR
jgi:hypothetical protein